MHKTVQDIDGIRGPADFITRTFATLRHPLRGELRPWPFPRRGQNLKGLKGKEQRRSIHLAYKDNVGRRALNVPRK